MPTQQDPSAWGRGERLKEDRVWYCPHDRNSPAVLCHQAAACLPAQVGTLCRGACTEDLPPHPERTLFFSVLVLALWLVGPESEWRVLSPVPPYHILKRIVVAGSRTYQCLSQLRSVGL